MSLCVTALTHEGAVRSTNEDTIVVGGRVMSQPMATPEAIVLDESPALALVCDGMGGHAAGEVASRAVAEHLAGRRAELTGPQALARAVDEANAELFALMDENPASVGMGTTVAGLVVSGADAFVFNVGDSRVYGFQDGRLDQLSTDDSPGAKRENRRTAVMTSSLITQVLGGGGRTPLDVHVLVEAADRRHGWLIASDGLTDLVAEAEIMRSLSGGPDGAIVRALFEAAMAAGGDDNVSILLVRPPPVDPNRG